MSLKSIQRYIIDRSPNVSKAHLNNKVKLKLFTDVVYQLFMKPKIQSQYRPNVCQSFSAQKFQKASNIEQPNVIKVNFQMLQLVHQTSHWHLFSSSSEKARKVRRIKIRKRTSAPSSSWTHPKWISTTCGGQMVCGDSLSENKLFLKPNRKGHIPPMKGPLIGWNISKSEINVFKTNFNESIQANKTCIKSICSDIKNIP